MLVRHEAIPLWVFNVEPDECFLCGYGVINRNAGALWGDGDGTDVRVNWGCVVGRIFDPCA